MAAVDENGCDGGGERERGGDGHNRDGVRRGDGERGTGRGGGAGVARLGDALLHRHHGPARCQGAGRERTEVSDTEFEWSNDRGAARVSATGLVTAVREGTGVVTATTASISGSAAVTVSLLVGSAKDRAILERCTMRPKAASGGTTATGSATRRWGSGTASIPTKKDGSSGSTWSPTPSRGISRPNSAGSMRSGSSDSTRRRSPRRGAIGRPVLPSRVRATEATSAGPDPHTEAKACNGSRGRRARTRAASTEPAS